MLSLFDFRPSNIRNSTERIIDEDYSQEKEVYLNMRTTRLMGVVVGSSVAAIALFSGISNRETPWVRVVSSSAFLTGISLAVGSQAFTRYAAYDVRRFVDGKLAVVNQLEQKNREWSTYFTQQQTTWQHQQISYQQEIHQLQTTKTQLTGELNRYEVSMADAVADRHRLQRDIQERDRHLGQLIEQHQGAIAQLTQEWERKYTDAISSLETLQSQQQQALGEMVRNAKFTIFQTVSEWHKRLSADLERGRFNGTSLEDLHDELLQVQTDHHHRIDSYQFQGNLNQVVDQLLSVLHHAGRDYSALHSKINLTTHTGATTIALTEARSQRDRLSAQLSDIKTQQLIPLAQHQQQLNDLLMQLEHLETQSQTNPVAQEAIARLDQLETQNQALLARIQELSAPILYRPANREDQRISNAIALFFTERGLILDRAYSDYHKWKATLYYHIDRNPQIVLDSELNEHSQKLTQLTGSLIDPKFNFDKSQGLMSVSVQLANKPPVGASEVNMLWKTADKFPSLVSKMSPRFRITGGSEGGKSPTAENLAVCILMAKKRAGTPYRVRVGNPMYNSKKNYWTLPQIWKSHAENLQALKEMKAHLESRASGVESRELFDLYLFDETDSTISQYGKSATELIFYGLKQVSHQHMGLILIGQSPNVSNYNSQRADWENAISIHIGTAAKHAIEKDDTLTAEDKTALKKQAEIIADYCAEQNRKNGFRIEGDNQTSQGYRYAWVREPNKHYWIQLPEFGCYQYDQLETVHPQTASASKSASTMHPVASAVHPEAGNPDSIVHPKVPSPTYLGYGCNKCDSGTFTSTKKNRGKTLYICGECGKSTSESVLSRHYKQQLEDLLPELEDDNNDE